MNNTYLYTICLKELIFENVKFEKRLNHLINTNFPVLRIMLFSKSMPSATQK